MNRNRVLGRLLLVVVSLGSACSGDEAPARCSGDECDEDPSQSGDDDTGDDDEDDSGDDDDEETPVDAGGMSADSARPPPAERRDSSSTPSTEDAARPATRDSAMPNDGGSTQPPPMMGGPAKKSAGCGKTMFPEAGNKTIDVDGTMREYITALPQGYDANRAYRLIFAWHGLGGTAASIARSWYGLSRRADNSAIFVAGQGLPTRSGGAGWENAGGRDVTFVQKLLASLLDSYCIDETRIFSTGMSYGGIMSNTLGCAMGDVFRAIAPMAGSGPLARGCKGQPAAWLTHGNTDTVVTFMSGQRSRDHWLMTNHCEMQTMPVSPMGCVAYQGCDDGKPVHWCEFSGGHTVPPFAAEGIWNFFAQF